MRILRIRLAHYRDVGELVIEPAPEGITLLVGPNETGKTSVAQALDLLLEYPASSSHHRVRAVKPVHEDEGTEIEAAFEAGPYRFTLFKRFHRRRETRLTVDRPRPESLTGREAHDRARAILAESVDLDLWKALRIEQGTETRLPELTGSGSLARALERAAGEAGTGEEAQPLFAAVRAEYEGWYTGKAGREKPVLVRASEEVRAAAGEVREVREALREAEAAVHRHADLDRAIADLSRELARLRKAETEAERAWEEVTALEAEIEKLRKRHEEAGREAEEAERRRKERGECIRRAAELAAAREKLGEERAAARSALEEARAARDRAVEGLRAARETLRLREEEEVRARGELEYRRAELDRDLLGERRARIREARNNAAAAERRLAEIRVDDDLLREIRAARLELERRKALAERSSPGLEVTALRDVEVDGEPLAAGDRLHRTVEEELSLTIGDLARVTVDPGESAAELIRTRDEAGERLARLLERAGVESLEEAARADEARKEAERIVAERDRILKENLRDLDPGRLEQKIENARRTVEAWLAENRPESSDFDDARDREKRAKEARRRAAEETEAAAAELDRTGSALQALEEKERGRELESETSGARLAAAEEVLARARQERSDEEVEEEARRRTEEAERRERELEEAEKRLETTQPKAVRLARETTREAVREAGEDLRRMEDERHRLAGRLEALGERGLAERLREARARLGEARREERSLRRRAEAARLLYTTMKKHRDAARRRYVKPLADGIVRLGRMIFGPTFRVELEEDLRVASRTLEGRTVPFESLSGGTKEQISLLTRLACARTVADSGGVPLILDDALGYTDPERLHLMGSILALAARDCQILILTCVPDRYRHAGPVKRIRMG